MDKDEIMRLKGQGILMRLLEMKGDDYSIDEVIIQPGVKANWLKFTETKVEHRAKNRGAKIEIRGAKKNHKIPTRKAIKLKKGEWHRLINETKIPVTAHVKLTPTWNPKRAYFRVGEKEYRGDEVWFEVKTYVGDTSDRALYLLHDLSAKQGNVSVLLKPLTKSLESFHKKGAVQVMCINGSGILYLNGKPVEMKNEDKIEVKPGTRYYYENNTKEPFEVNQIHAPQWEPDDTFYMYGERMIPGDQAWFEFVVAQ